MLPLFAAAIFLSALLLFMVQPMAAKGILPLLGGSPGVWNTCMLFFQALLLAGYAYAHGLTHVRNKWAQIGIHGAVVGIAAVMLPIAVPSGWKPPTDGMPTIWMLGLLGVMVGAPFFVLSTTGPLLQHWFARSGHKAAKDPYFLYAASNAGSLLGLLGYPLIVEPLLGVRDQGIAWAWGYAALAPLLIAGGVVSLRAAMRQTEATGASGRAGGHARRDASPEVGELAGEAPTWRRRLWWIFLAFVPSSMVLGTTQYLSTDIAAIPLMWVIPLSIYLISFIIAFGARRFMSLDSMRKLLPFAAMAISLVTLIQVREPVLVIIALHLLTLFLATTLCHSRLADARPAPARLTEYYLLMAVGGVLGGIFNAIVAPSFFNDVYEYPIAIFLACLCIPAVVRANASPQKERSRRILDFLFPAAVGSVLFSLYPAALLIAQQANVRLLGGALFDTLYLLITTVACIVSWRRPIRFAMLVGVVLMLSPTLLEGTTVVKHKERTFFGVLRVQSTNKGQINVLRHGTTIHGIQIMTPGLERRPLVYYHPDGPIGDVMFLMHDDDRLKRTAMIGMGVGAMAAYGREGDEMDFYEIDPSIETIARNPEYFTYLADSKAKLNVIIGDGRLTLADAPDGEYGLIVVDAFSSDAIPVHLITLEATQLYLSKLREDGVLAFHISNRHLKLDEPLVGIANALGVRALICHQLPKDDDPRNAWRSTWLIMTRDLKHVMTLGQEMAEPNRPR
jgi:hypothetical protein